MAHQHASTQRFAISTYQARTQLFKDKLYISESRLGIILGFRRQKYKSSFEYLEWGQGHEYFKLTALDGLKSTKPHFTNSLKSLQQLSLLIPAKERDLRIYQSKMGCSQVSANLERTITVQLVKFTRQIRYSTIKPSKILEVSRFYLQGYPQSRNPWIQGVGRPSEHLKPLDSTSRYFHNHELGNQRHLV